jgi:hypothetical protein
VTRPAARSSAPSRSRSPKAIATCWHATTDIEDHGAHAPWYTTKAQPSTADMLAKLRRVLIAANFRASHPGQPAGEEISVIRRTWDEAAA